MVQVSWHLYLPVVTVNSAHLFWAPVHLDQLKCPVFTSDQPWYTASHHRQADRRCAFKNETSPSDSSDMQTSVSPAEITTCHLHYLSADTAALTSTLLLSSHEVAICSSTDDRSDVTMSPQVAAHLFGAITKLIWKFISRVGTRQTPEAALQCGSTGENYFDPSPLGESAASDRPRKKSRRVGWRATNQYTPHFQRLQAYFNLFMSQVFSFTLSVERRAHGVLCNLSPLLLSPTTSYGLSWSFLLSQIFSSSLSLLSCPTDEHLAVHHISPSGKYVTCSWKLG